MCMNSKSSFLVQGRPAEARGHGRLVIFPLDHVLRAALIEAENFVVEIEAIHDELQAMYQAIAALNVHLEVGIEVDVAIWPLDSSRSYGGRTTSERIRSVLISILEDVRGVVGQ